uniref:Uncharacterized protein n=1 Tax=viral metagenome TaxID=1070528 RepID=A0A6C0J0E6_9ZZZZ
MDVSDNTLGSWTRTKNDQTTCDNDNYKNTELYSFMTFSPDYLTQGSCVAGNTQNCTSYAAIDVDKESRFGVLTNLNEIQRDTTNDISMGLKTTPDFSSGKLIDPRLIQDMSTLESKFEHTTRLNIPASSQMNEHQFDEEARYLNSMPDVFARDAIRVSSRVSRRNTYADSCKRA